MAITKPLHAGKMVMVLAGCTEDIGELMRSNPGLRSLFITHVDFPFIEPQQCVQHLRKELGKLRIEITGDNIGPKDVEQWDNAHGTFSKSVQPVDGRMDEAPRHWQRLSSPMSSTRLEP